MAVDIKELARLGAQARLTELQEEITALYTAFPELRSGKVGAAGRRRGRPRRQAAAANSSGNDSPSTSRKARKRRGMSAAKRREVSERMKKYWAQRRKAESA